jgi:hypothetical protein
MKKKKQLTLYHDKRTGAALMIASSQDEAVYFPYNIDNGKFAYGMHGPTLGPNKLPVKYFQALNPQTNRDADAIAKDLEIVLVPH